MKKEGVDRPPSSPQKRTRWIDIYIDKKRTETITPGLNERGADGKSIGHKREVREEACPKRKRGG